MIRLCEKCTQKNRVPAAKLAQEGRCGACKAVLPAVSTPIDVGLKEFEDVVGGAKVPILVDFWAEWCGPCRMAAPQVARVAREMSGRAIVLKVDTETQPELARRFQVQGIPNFLVLMNGSVVQQQAGLVDHSVMKSWLEGAGG